MSVGKKVWKKEDLYPGMEVIHYNKKYKENNYSFIIHDVHENHIEMVNIMSFDKWYCTKLPLSERIEKNQNYKSWKPSILDVLKWLNDGIWLPFNYKQKEPIYECW